MSVDVIGRSLELQNKLRLTTNELRAIFLTCALTAITLSVGLYSLVTFPQRAEREKLNNISVVEEQYPVGSPEYSKMYESSPKRARDSAIEISLIVDTGETYTTMSRCSGSIVDRKSVSWKDGVGQVRVGSLYTGTTAEHCFGGTQTIPEKFEPDMYQIITSKDVISGKRDGVLATPITHRQIVDMTDGAIFSFVVEDGGIDARPTGIDMLAGRDEVTSEESLTTISFPSSVAEDYPRVFSFSAMNFLNPNANQFVVEVDAFKGESGSNGFTEYGKSTGMFVSLVPGFPDLCHYSTYPGDIRQQISDYINSILVENQMSVFKSDGMK